MYNFTGQEIARKAYSAIMNLYHLLLKYLMSYLTSEYILLRHFNRASSGMT